MDQELQETLFEKFPELYADRDKSCKESLVCFGFAMGNGWYQLVHDLSQELDTIIRKLPEDQRGQFRAAQMKEKFGQLRFYMTSYLPEMEEIIRKYEALSYKTCENCGEPGEPGGKGWVHTLCDLCRVQKDLRVATDVAECLKKILRDFATIEPEMPEDIREHWNKCVGFNLWVFE